MKKLYSESDRAALRRQFLTKSNEAGTRRPKAPEGSILRVIGIDYLEFTHEGERVSVNGGGFKTITNLTDWVEAGRKAEDYSWEEVGLRLAIRGKEIEEWALSISELTDPHSRLTDLNGQEWKAPRGLQGLLDQHAQLDYASREWQEYLTKTFETYDLKVILDRGARKADPQTGEIKSGWTGRRNNGETWHQKAIRFHDLVPAARHAVENPLIDLLDQQDEYHALLAKENRTPEEDAKMLALKDELGL